jgi:two-component system sensor histidine kinase/response regulator
MDKITNQGHVILIVDDNPQNLQVLGRLLQENKYEIEFATNGKAALDWLNTRPFDLILLDINMPGMSGFEVCTTVRLNPAFNKVPVIFLSAEADRESILKGFEIGAQDYITKPFDSRELLSRVRTHLALKESLENLADINELLEEKVAERTLQLKEANEKLGMANLRLIDIDKAKADFLNLISHEIRTPLNGIMGPMELLKGPVSAAELNELVKILDLSVMRLEKFAADALLITRLKTNPTGIKKTAIHLLKLINDVVEEEKENTRVKNLKVFVKEEETENKIISGETELIKKSLYNIINNSITYSPPGGTIEISVSFEKKVCSCEITDNGNGFDADFIEKGFKLFTTGSQYHDSRTGIGLPVVKMIMEAHGGELIIGNRPGGGALVKLIFR